jgi:hypothetical protein
MTETTGRRLPDFWLSSGFHLLRRDIAGHLAVTDDFVAAYLRRPEMRLVEESDAAERALHARLGADPYAAIAEEELTALGDAAARSNYRVFLDFRDRLLEAGTLERAYRAWFDSDPVTVPMLLRDHLVHAILRNILSDCDDSIALRAAELLFRTQKATIAEGAVMLADEETVEVAAQTGGLGALGRLLIDNGTPLREVVLDVLSDDNAASYWARSDRFDTVLDLSFGRRGLDALCRVLERWVMHFLGVALAIEPVSQIRDERWSWHVGLDVESMGVLNAIYRGEKIEKMRLDRLIALFRARFLRPADMRPELRGKPIYLALAMDAHNRVRLKPQNLLLNLPLSCAS